MSRPRSRSSRLVTAALAAIALAGALSIAGEHTARADRVSRLAEALVDGASEKTRLAAAVNLGRIGDARALRPLLIALHDDSNVVRAVAASALGHLGFPAALPSLHQAARDDDPSVRERAREAIARIEIKVGARRRAAKLLPRKPRRRSDYQISARERPRIPDTSPSLHVVVHSVVDRSGQASRSRKTRRRRLVKRFVSRELHADPAITTDEKMAERNGIAPYAIDVSIEKLSRHVHRRRVEVECRLRVAISDRRGRMLSFVTSRARVHVPRRTYRRQYLPQLAKEAMENAVKGVHQDLVAYLSRTASR